MSQDLPYSPAADRNRAPILEALRGRMPQAGRLLEIGAGSGQHAVYLAKQFPAIQWLPSERGDALPGLVARLRLEGGPNLLPARILDVVSDAWPAGLFAAAYSANTAHIMPWEAVRAMLRGLGDCLQPGAPLFLYGPFNVDGQFTAPSNAAFDASLRRQDPRMGLRDLDALESCAAGHQLQLQERIDMPANNFLLVFRKQEDG